MYGIATGSRTWGPSLAVPARSPKGIIKVRAAVSTVAEPRQQVRRSLYEILRVKKTASQREIKSAYRTLAKLYHPDASDSSSSSSEGVDFVDINNAYETLSDPESRAMYDLSLTLSLMAGPVGLRPRPGGYYPSRRWETDQCW